MQKITSIDHLKKAANKETGDFVQFYIFLADGIAKSGKRISYRPQESKNWLIINEVDESYQELLDKNLGKRTLIVEAIERDSLFLSEIQ